MKGKKDMMENDTLTPKYAEYHFWKCSRCGDVISITSDYNEQSPLMCTAPVQGDGFLYGIRPSYWNPKHQFLCKMP